MVPYPLGVAPGQRFRFEQYLALLEAHGFTVKVFPFLSAELNELLYKPGNYPKKIGGVLTGFIRRMIALPQILSANWVFIFREATPLGPPVFEWIITQVFRKKIIYDFDDAIWLPNTSEENKIISWLKWHGKVKAICRWSYRVSCGNDYLASFAKEFNKSVVINPTTIDTEILHNASLYPSEKNESMVTIGWTGSHSTLPYLELVGPAIRALSDKYANLRFLVISDKAPTWNLRCLEFRPWSKETEIRDLLAIDIGIMPLPDDAWARGKCGFKALQYMSLGKPALVSPVGVNVTIVDDGSNGYYCSTDAEWMSNLEFLITRKEVCVSMGAKGREKVINHYSTVSNASNFLCLFE